MLIILDYTASILAILTVILMGFFLIIFQYKNKKVLLIIGIFSLITAAAYALQIPSGRNSFSPYGTLIWIFQAVLHLSVFPAIKKWIKNNQWLKKQKEPWADMDDWNLLHQVMQKINEALLEKLGFIIKGNGVLITCVIWTNQTRPLKKNEEQILELIKRIYKTAGWTTVEYYHDPDKGTTTIVLVS